MENSMQKCPNCGGNKAILTRGNQYQCQYCGTTFAGANEPAGRQSVDPVCRCPICGGEIVVGAQKCRHCGEWLTPRTPAVPVTPQPVYHHVVQHSTQKSKVAAALLALFFGSLGAHEFYLGRSGAGICFLLATLLTCWLIVPIFIIGFITLIQAISYLSMSDEQFAAKYH